MKLHEIKEIHSDPYFRKMRVESGYMYNFYSCEKDQYNIEWIFVPDAGELKETQTDCKHVFHHFKNHNLEYYECKKCGHIDT